MSKGMKTRMLMRNTECGMLNVGVSQGSRCGMWMSTSTSLFISTFRSTSISKCHFPRSVFHIHTHTHTHNHIRIHTNIYTHVHTSIHIYIQIQVRNRTNNTTPNRTGTHLTCTIAKLREEAHQAVCETLLVAHDTPDTVEIPDTMDPADRCLSSLGLPRPRSRFMAGDDLDLSNDSRLCPDPHRLIGLSRSSSKICGPSCNLADTECLSADGL